MTKSHEAVEVNGDKNQIHEAFGITCERAEQLCHIFLGLLQTHAERPISFLLQELTKQCDNINESIFVAYQAGSFFEGNAVNIDAGQLNKIIDRMQMVCAQVSN